jgi:signal recognition particle subunit SRP54
VRLRPPPLGRGGKGGLFVFQELSGKLERVFRGLRNRGRLDEGDVRDAMREIRVALLEADVHFRVAKEFVARTGEKALGREILRSVTPGQHVVKIVHDELVQLLGGENAPLDLSSSPSPVLLVGLQGSGKTTQAAKLGVHLRKQGRRPLLVAADLQRPAAIDQLEVLGRSTDLPVLADRKASDVIGLARAARERARAEGHDVLLFDTAGRLHVDEAMMEELAGLERAVEPDEALLVLDAMTGQEAVNVAETFSGRLSVSGLLLTKLDGDARGGAALSIRQVTGLPVKFVGTGEKPGDLEPFHPERMAGRILGMGDVVSLVEKAQETVDREQAAELEEKLRTQTITLEDFREQLRQVKKMGPLSQIMGMLPGGGALKNVTVDDRELYRVEAIIQSMTPAERRNPSIIDGSRRRRIASGSGTTLQDVNRLLKQFGELKRMMKKMSKMGKSRGLPIQS